MGVGDVIDERFELEAVAGAGGMGTVFRARDRLEGLPVAVKVLEHHHVTDTARFTRESRVLAELSLAHPAIVRYIANGVMSDETPYLVMEWLEGEDLAVRLLRASRDGEGDCFSEAEAVVMMRRVAAALAVAHGRGLIHRDIKPSNLFLVDGDPRQVKVLDFGLARSIAATQQLTRTGMVLGTAGYMAPEQVEGQRDLDARVDVFALGCVLFECVTGQPAFAGDRAFAVLAKVLLHEAPSVREIRPELSAAIEGIVATMLCKSREDRPADASAVMEALERLGDIELPTRIRDEPQSRLALTAGEQQLLSILLISLGGDEPLSGDEPTMVDEIPPIVRELAEPLKGQMHLMASGTIAIATRGVGDATTQAARAASCALSIREALFATRVALSIGLAEVTGRWPVGPVVDRAVELLESSEVATEGEAVLVDDVTAGLLETRFEVRGAGEIRQLLRARFEPSGRRLLGKPTPCAGRDKELAFLVSTFEECVDEPMAQAVIISGVAGVGKTRLRQEFVERVHSVGGMSLLDARGDPLAAGSAFVLVSQIVRSGVNLREGEGIGLQYAQLRRSLEELGVEEDQARLSEFLGELIRAPTTDEPSALLRAARNDARIMSEQLKEAFVDWLGILCRKAPVLIVLEDFQWGDLPSVTYLEEALRRHTAAPIMVLALARPEASDVFPSLWSSSVMQKMGLGPLRRRACEKLVRAALGDEVPTATLERIVTRAGGNAFYLEELIRHVAEHGDRDLPGTVLAMAQSRLDRLDSEARRLLRAGSVFGDLFWDGAVATLLGGTISDDDRMGWLESMVEVEVLERGRSGKFPDQREFVFRHGLLREAAYAMLTKNDRALGHRLAAEWLEEVGEKDALALAEHFERGGEPARAVPYLIKAAQAAIEGLNLDAAQDLSERAIANGAEGEDHGALKLIQTMRLLWLDDYESVGSSAAEALSLLPKGSVPWLLSVGLLSLSGSFGGDPKSLMLSLEQLQGVKGALLPVGPSARACSMLYVSLLHTGQLEVAQDIFGRLEASNTDDADVVFEGWLRITRAIRCLYGHELLGVAFDNIEAAARCFEEARDYLSSAVAEIYMGWCQFEAGALEACETICLAVLERADQGGHRFPAGFATYYLGLSRILQGRPEEGRETLRPCFNHSNAAIASAAQVADALAMLQSGLHEEAEGAARRIAESLMHFPIIRNHALAVLANAELALRRPEEALVHAREGLDGHTRFGAGPAFESLLRLAEIEALQLLGDAESAEASLDEARVRLFEQAASFKDESLRLAYLGVPPANARIISAL